jgi:acetyl esterase/lipase
MRAIYFIVSLAIFASCLVGCEQNTSANKAAPNAAPQQASEQESYLSRRAKFNTNLLRKGPSHQDWEDEPLSKNVSKILYKSGGNQLKAWLFRPPSAKNEKHPGLVYLHGGFAFGMDDMTQCKPFIDAGFIVLCPSLRGENGNPGDFEMMLGEVDDAAAAIQWLAKQEFVDAEKIFVFGHSSGGVISAVLSLYDNLPVQRTGSSGGLYGVDLFEDISDIVPFDTNDPRESQLRVLIGNVRWMKRPHIGYVGTADSLMRGAVGKGEADEAKAPLTVIEIPGDHHTSLPPAMKAFLDNCVNNK